MTPGRRAIVVSGANRTCIATIVVVSRIATRMIDFVHHVARRRVPLGFASALAALWLARPTPRSLACGAAVALAGEAIRVWAAGHLEKGREVTTTGPYAFTRHPLYLGSTVIGAGMAIACWSFAVAVLVAAYLTLTLTAAIRTEEAHLTEKFGPAYPDYRSGRLAPTARRFSLERAIRNREYRAVTGLVIAIAALLLKMLTIAVPRGHP